MTRDEAIEAAARAVDGLTDRRGAEIVVTVLAALGVLKLDTEPSERVVDVLGREVFGVGQVSDFFGVQRAGAWSDTVQPDGAARPTGGVPPHTPSGFAPAQKPVSLSEQAEALPPEMIAAGADAVAAFNPEYEEPEDRAVLVYRAMVAAKTEGRKARTQLRCEPPPEHMDKRWHWLTRRGEKMVAAWLPVEKRWRLVGWAHSFNPDAMPPHIWRYVAPCLPPEEKP